MNGLLSGSMYALMALGFSMIWGIVGLFNFAHGAFYMLGGYIAYYLIEYLGVSPLASIVISAITMFFVGVIVERFCVRPLNRYQGSDIYILATAVVTLALAVFLENIILLTFGGAIENVSPIITGVLNLGFYSVSNQIVAVLFIAGICIGLIGIYLRYTKTGLAMQSLAQDSIGASLSGVNSNIIYPITFGISAALAGIAGGLLSPVYSIFPTVGWSVFPFAFIVVIIGGLGTVKGVLIAAYLVGIIKCVSTIWISGQWVLPIIFGILILILLLKPSGLFGVREE